MLINPKTVVKNGWITGVEDHQIQPNAIDFTVDRLFTIDETKPFVISEDGKEMRGGRELDMFPKGCQYEGHWRIAPNSVHDAMSNMHVTVPEDVAVLLIIRSTFNRNGIYITNGLYDSGFEGSIGFAIHNRSGVAYVKPGTRIGQIMFTHADSEGKYAGGWNTKEGQHWSES